MSNIIFPTPANQKQGGPTWPATKTPSYKTIVQTPASNRGENRLSLTPYPIWKFELDFEFLRGDFSPAQAASYIQALVGFAGSVKGSFDDWLYNDPYDNSVSGAVFGYGDGSTKQFQLVRQIQGLNDIVQNPNWAQTINVSVAGVVQTIFAYSLGQENLLLQSQAFNVSPWTLGNVGASNPTVTANSTAAPDGTTTADTIAFPSTVGGGVESYIVQTVTSLGSANTSFIYSIWLKCASGSQTVTLEIDGPEGFLGGTVVTVTTAWTRYSVSVATDALSPIGSFFVFVFTRNQAAQTVFAWGAQLERGTVPSGYLATTTSQALNNNGLVTFVTAPTSGQKLTWSGNFYHRCRFDDDEWSELREFLNTYWELRSLKFRSVIL